MWNRYHVLESKSVRFFEKINYIYYISRRQCGAWQMMFKLDIELFCIFDGTFQDFDVNRIILSPAAGRISIFFRNIMI